MKINTQNPLFVFALQQESDGLFDDLPVLYTGVGKTLAALHLTKSIATSKPDIVINMGTAGSATHNAGAIVNPTAFIQRDMDVTPLGFSRFQTPYSDDDVTLRYGERLDLIPEATCGTGDNFAVNEDFGGGLYDIVDMEAYALATVCNHYNIPFLCLKYISDGADGSANQDWQKALHDTAKSLRQIVDQHIL